MFRAIGTKAVAGTGRPLYLSGALGLKPGSTKLESGVEAQTDQAIANIDAILKSSGIGFSAVVNTKVMLKNLDDYGAVSKVIASKFESGRAPSQTMFQVSRLPMDALVEIEAVAILTYSNCDAY